MQLGVRVLTVTWLVALGSAVAVLGGAWLVGYELDVVTTPSMEPELPEESLVVVRPVRPDRIRGDDVIAFRDPGDATRTVLHRVVGFERIGNVRYFRTKGDANNDVDPRPVPPDAIEGRMVLSAPRLGWIVRVFASTLGPAFLVALPLLVYAISELVDFRRRHRVRGDAVLSITAA